MRDSVGDRVTKRQREDLHAVREKVSAKPTMSLGLAIASLTVLATLGALKLVIGQGDGEERLVESAYSLLFAPNTPPLDSVNLLRKALIRDSASPYRWCDLGESLAESGDRVGAQRCFAQAVRLGPHVPAILLRAALFDLATGETDRALTEMAAVLAETREYDDVIFLYYDRIADQHRVWRYGMPNDHEPVRLYCLHLGGLGQCPAEWIGSRMSRLGTK